MKEPPGKQRPISSRSILGLPAGQCYAAAMVFPGVVTRLAGVLIFGSGVLVATAQIQGYTVKDAFSGLIFNQPLCFASPPQETNRLFILEKTGDIVVITNLAAPTRTVFMSLSVASYGDAGLLGLAFHPGYATNRYFYVFSSRFMDAPQGLGLYECISRFQTTATNANLAFTNTEVFLISQPDDAQDHNGGDLHFGPDGYLYASVGDEGGQYNVNQNAQVITNKFNSGILRLDVDKRPGNLLPNPYPASSTNYFVPADNFFVGVTNFNGHTFSATNVRTEFYAIGMRNPWRFSIDPVTGFVYVGDVGQDLYEEVDVITNGANCGWAYYEGFHLAAALYPAYPTLQTNPPAGLNFPIQEIPHYGTTNYTGNCVIGGVVYRGNRLPQLYGAYVFTDNGSGSVWMLRYDGSNTIPFQYLATASDGPSAMGTDPRNGDILIAQFNTGQIGRLDYEAGPRFNLAMVYGTNLILRGTNGWPDRYFTVLAATNLAIPAAQWRPLFTNPFDAGGNFNLTSPVSSGAPMLFYRLQLP